MAKVIKKGEGIVVRCTGEQGHGGNGCGAILSVTPEDLFTVTSLADPSSNNKAFRCPQCNTTSDLELNRVKQKKRGSRG